MKDYIEERAIEIANYIIENNATVRQTAKAFGISKSTVHKDVAERLEKIRASKSHGAKLLRFYSLGRGVRQVEQFKYAWIKYG